MNDLTNQAFSHYLNSDFLNAKRLYKNILANGTTGEQNDVSFAITMYKSSMCYLNTADYASARKSLLAAKTIFENRSGTDDPQLAITLRFLAEISRILDSPLEAEMLSTRALEIWQEYLLPANPSTNIDWNDFDELYGRKSNEDQIKHILLSAQKRHYELSLYDMPFAAAVMYELAILKKSAGKYKTSLNLSSKALDLVSADSISAAKILQEIGEASHQIGRYDQAIKLYGQALTILQNYKFYNHPDIPYLYFLTARSFLSNSSYYEAEELLVKAMNILEKNSDIQHPLSANILKELANIHKNKKDYKKAESMYKQACEIICSSIGERNSALAAIFDDLALLYQDQKRFEESETLWFRAIDLTQTEPQLQSNAKFFDRLACLYKLQNKYQKAESVYRKALNIRKNILLGNKKDIAQSHLDIAHFYLDWCKFIEAQNYFISSLELTENLYGTESTQAQKCREGLGIVLTKLGKYKDAQLLLNQVLDSKEKSNDPQSLISILICLGDLDIELENYDLATAKYNQAAQIVHTMGKENNDTLCKIMSLKAKTKAKKNAKIIAIDYYEKSLSLMESSSSTDYITLIDILASLSLLYEQEHQQEKAEAILNYLQLIVSEKADKCPKEIALMHLALARSRTYSNTVFSHCKQALNVAENSLGPHHPLVVESLCLLGNYYQNNNQPGQAIETYIRALTIMESLYSGMHPNLGHTLMELGNLHLRLGNNTQAKSLFRRALTIFEQCLGLQHSSTIDANSAFFS